MVSSPDPHAARSTLEAALCSEMRAQSVAHEHRSLHFRVHLDERKVVEFTPDLVARRGAILFLVEPLAEGAADRNRLRLLERFLETHSPEIVLLLVTTDRDTRDLPPESYDEAYPSTDLSQVVRRIKEQSPQGLVLPVRKPTPSKPGEDDAGGDE